MLLLYVIKRAERGAYYVVGGVEEGVRTVWWRALRRGVPPTREPVG
jgi:hypothetical protein